MGAEGSFFCLLFSVEILFFSLLKKKKKSLEGQLRPENNFNRSRLPRCSFVPRPFLSRTHKISH